MSVATHGQVSAVDKENMAGIDAQTVASQQQMCTGTAVGCETLAQGTADAGDVLTCSGEANLAEAFTSSGLQSKARGKGNLSERPAAEPLRLLNVNGAELPPHTPCPNVEASESIEGSDQGVNEMAKGKKLKKRSLKKKGDAAKASPSVTLLGSDAAATGSDAPSLQDAFKRFKKQRATCMRLTRNREVLKRDDPAVMQKLREKFVAQARTYFGVPYHKRYQEKGTPEYDSPIFLDCCGLVRRVLYDLQEDFGFRIGPWNQAYMFDILPNVLDGPEQMELGDLVFVSAQFYDPKKKTYAHNMVHVEIWAGDGEKTIGARWQRGKVQVHDSYMYDSKSYHSMVYHFRSIDTWLKGICKSFCPEHAWRGSTFVLSKHVPSKKSIFYADYVGSQRTSAISQPATGGNPEEKVPSDCDVAVTMSTSSDQEAADEPEVEAADDIIESELHSDDITNSDLASSGSPGCSVEMAAPVADGDGDETKKADDGQGGKSNPSAAAATASSHSKQATAAKKKKTPSGSGSSKKKQGGAAAGGGGSGGVRTSTMASRSTTVSHAKLTFCVCGANGASLVHETLAAKGWKPVDNPRSLNFKLKWAELKSSINFEALKPGEQLVNHIPNMGAMTTKIGLAMSLREHCRTLAQRHERGLSRTRPKALESFFPQTFNMEMKIDREEFLQQYQEGDIWICKPSGCNRGIGIQLMRSLEAICHKFGMSCVGASSAVHSPGGDDGTESGGGVAAPNAETRSSGAATAATATATSKPAATKPQSLFSRPGYILQRYISRPLLLAGSKFDVRCYMLIAGTTPFIVLYHHGYVRRCILPYDVDSADRTAHLTNQAVQKKVAGFEDVKEDTVWTMEQLQTYLSENWRNPDDGTCIAADYVAKKMTKDIHQIMMLCFNSVKSKLQVQNGFFELLGFDFLIDESLKVWLLEVNKNPSLHTNNDVLVDLIPDLVKDTLTVVLEVHHKVKRQERILPLANKGNFVMLHHEDRR